MSELKGYAFARESKRMHFEAVGEKGYHYTAYTLNTTTGIWHHLYGPGSNIDELKKASEVRKVMMRDSFDHTNYAIVQPVEVEDGSVPSTSSQDVIYACTNPGNILNPNLFTPSIGNDFSCEYIYQVPINFAQASIRTQDICFLYFFRHLKDTPHHDRVRQLAKLLGKRIPFYVFDDGFKIVPRKVKSRSMDSRESRGLLL